MKSSGYLSFKDDSNNICSSSSSLNSSSSSSSLNSSSSSSSLNSSSSSSLNSSSSSSSLNSSSSSSSSLNSSSSSSIDQYRVTPASGFPCEPARDQRLSDNGSDTPIIVSVHPHEKHKFVPLETRETEAETGGHHTGQSSGCCPWWKLEQALHVSHWLERSGSLSNQPGYRLHEHRQIGRQSG
ncbi:hypothetical protein PoB_001350400 [Plakobranchus ocellatus]|uniref:REJ domain-containing protein n=1 Tax=Plakobranchus ocellatus TaxID=259542 RepID=A0AAV3YVA3_9GAST|nr:hypothetical protein PoB_001350400 [Plakobranchus ocellatus]